MMDSVRNPVEALHEMVSTSKTELLLLFLSTFFFGISLVIFFITSNKINATDNKIIIDKKSAQSVQSKKIIVDIGGSVERPGVYELDAGSRVRDVMVSANGLSANADRQFIAASFNGARILEDGEKIYIPSVSEKPNGTISGQQQVVLGSATSKININFASMEQLDTLPGIGEKTAQKIIAGRPYATIIELREKKVVGQAVFDKIKDQIISY